LYPATPVPVSVLAFHEKVMVELLLTVTAGDDGTVGALVSDEAHDDIPVFEISLENVLS